MQLHKHLSKRIIVALVLALLMAALAPPILAAGPKTVLAAEEADSRPVIRGFLFKAPEPLFDFEAEMAQYQEKWQRVEEFKKKDKLVGMFLLVVEVVQGFNAMLMTAIFDALKGMAGWVFWEVNIFGGSGEVTIVNYYRSFYMIALSALAAIIAWYAIKMITGNVEVPPIEMLVRISLIFGLMTFGLALIQDLLSINNAFVNFFLSGGAEGESLAQIMTLIEARAYESANIVFTLLLSLLMLVLVGVEIIALSIWAYYRMYTIYILAAIAPIAMLTLVFPSWSKVFSKWLQMLVRNIFVQAAWALSYVFGIRILSNAVAADVMFASILASLAGWFAVMLMSPKLLELFEMDTHGYQSNIKSLTNLAGGLAKRRLFRR